MSVVIEEEALQFGEGGRLFGVLTVPCAVPRADTELPVFVFLSAGLLHRVGPYRLHVRLARELARTGFASLRVDLSASGDSPPRPGLTNQQSVAADFAEILNVLGSRLGQRPLVLGGLCTGADNSMTLALKEPRVVGMLLLDPICFPDTGVTGYKARAAMVVYGHPARYIAWFKRRYQEFTGRRDKPQLQEAAGLDPLAIRDYPDLPLMRAAFEAIGARKGRVLSVFTHYATRYYNQTGQLGRSLRVAGYRQFCTELFWPQVDHTYRLELHRRRLIEEVKVWTVPYLNASVQRAPAVELPRSASETLARLAPGNRQSVPSEV